MGALMKTTLDISDPLFNSAKAFAQQSQTTLRALVEEGLRRVLSDRQAHAQSTFRLKNASVHGQLVGHTTPQDWRKMEEDHIAAHVMRPFA